MWNILKEIKKGDYLYALVPDHPKATKNGYVLYHRAVMENFLERELERDEVVHHRDGNKLNNSIDNLELMLAADHNRAHIFEKLKSIGKEPGILYTTVVCSCCGVEFKRRTAKIKPGHLCFCSYSCNGKYYSESDSFFGKGNKIRKYSIHGTINCYRHGCRCSLCRVANAKQGREDRAKRNK